MLSTSPRIVRSTVNLVRSCARSRLRSSHENWGVSDTDSFSACQQCRISSGQISCKLHSTAPLCSWRGQHHGARFQDENCVNSLRFLGISGQEYKPVYISPLNCESVRFYRTASRQRARDSQEPGKSVKSEDPGKSSDSSETRDPTDSSVGAESEKGLTVFQRFKKAYREHGKILIGVHLVTSTVWFGSFFYAASKGIDVVPWLEYIGVSETLIKPFRSPNVGNIAMAYLMYKLATPARYTVTLGGTNMVIRHMRRTGRMDPVPEGDSLRELYQDGKDRMKERRHEIPSRISKRVKTARSHSHKSRTKH